MSEAEIISRLEELASDLQVAGERVPLDRVVKRHRQALASAREAELPWEALARLLAKTGARRSSGEPFSSHQLRASFARATTETDKLETHRVMQPVTDEAACHDALRSIWRQHGQFNNNESDRASTLPPLLTWTYRTRISRPHGSGSAKTSRMERILP